MSVVVDEAVRLLSLYPGGIQAISRWLSAATPPDWSIRERFDPEGCRSRRFAATPFGVATMENLTVPWVRCATHG